MTAEEAIKIQERPQFGATWPLPRLEIEATKLGIEALKFFKDLRDRGALPPGTRLPGETYIPQSVGKLPSDKAEE